MIVRNHITLFVQNYGPEIVLQQNNARLHVARAVQNELQVRNIDTVPCSRFLSLSRLDYGNAVLAGSPHVLLVKIQRVVNYSVRRIGTSSKSAQITHLIYGLHWRPISSRSQYKTAFICFHAVSGTAHPYFSEQLHLYFPSHSLRSPSDILCSNDGQEDPEEESRSIYRTCQLEHYYFVFIFFQVKTENSRLLLCKLICHSTDISLVMQALE